MSKDLIIKVEYGGLGDHLFFSHIPRIAKLGNTNGGGGGINIIEFLTTSLAHLEKIITRDKYGNK
uniref:hypothetical protein n=1 Tax=Helicobacter bilis TaxID=37372 RepID=UPI0026EAD847